MPESEPFIASLSGEARAPLTALLVATGRTPQALISEAIIEAERRHRSGEAAGGGVEEKQPVVNVSRQDRADMVLVAVRETLATGLRGLRHGDLADDLEGFPILAEAVATAALRAADGDRASFGPAPYPEVPKSMAPVEAVAFAIYCDVTTDGWPLDDDTRDLIAERWADLSDVDHRFYMKKAEHLLRVSEAASEGSE